MAKLYKLIYIFFIIIVSILEKQADYEFKAAECQQAFLFLSSFNFAYKIGIPLT